MINRGPRYLRLSVTARCGLHCLYCRPRGCEPAGVQDELTVGQLRLLVQCAAAEGVRKVRITGGEPLQRPDLEEIVAAVSSVPGIAETVLTTNGVALAGRAAALRQSGLQRLNISLDTLRPERFAVIAGQDKHAEVMAGVGEAVRTFPAVKTNTVLLRGRNDDEIEDLVRFGARTGVRVRFVEYYRTACSLSTEEGLSAGEVRQRLERAFGPLVPVAKRALSAETVYQLPSGGLNGATVGLIASVTSPPCATCTKLRLTASGALLPCLFAESGESVRPLLETADRAAVRQAIRRAFARKERRGRRREVKGAVWAIGG